MERKTYSRTGRTETEQVRHWQRKVRIETTANALTTAASLGLAFAPDGAPVWARVGLALLSYRASRDTGHLLAWQKQAKSYLQAKATKPNR